MGFLTDILRKGNVDDGVVLQADPDPVATDGKIGKNEVREAEKTLQEYKRGKANLESRIVDNEQWYKLRHWDQIRASNRNPGDPEPTSAWLLNCIANKHADAMDNYPLPAVLPRERGDEQDAKMLSSILPVILEQNGFEQVYSDAWWYKLKTGTCVYGVFWDSSKNNGLGDIDVRSIDILNLFWEPGITNIQKSRNLFHVDLVDRDIIEAQYPNISTALTAPTVDTAKYIYDDAIDTSKKVAVIDWYYKQTVNGKTVLHYCKFCNGEVLYASENDPACAERGFYDHGKYPFVFDTLFPEAGTPAGFGYVDICKSPQLYIDKLDQAILKHAVMSARQRFFVRDSANVNEGEFAEWNKEFVHVTGTGNIEDSVVPIQIPPLSESCVTVRSLKIDELKETSGNRDFSQGGTTSGVTAASAIAALQEAGSKLSRDMLKSSNRANAEICYLIIDLMRQFYSETRYFRVTGENGAVDFAAFDGSSIAAKPQGGDFGLELGYRVPIFDIKVVPQRSSPFSTVAQNERAKELYGMGFFRPDLSDQALAALEMMDFEGIDKVRERIAQNGTMYQQLMQLQQQMVQLASIVDAQNGTTITQGFLQSNAGVQGNPIAPASDGADSAEDGVMGQTQGAARVAAARQATPK